MTLSARAKSWVGNLVAITGSTVAALLLVEALIRTPPIAKLYAEPPVAEGVVIVGATHQELFVEYDSLLGWRKVANSANWFESTEWRIREEINAEGLRGPDLPKASGPDERRVLLLGDSFVEGYTQDFGETVGAVLETELEASGEWTVINGGTGGYSTDQELLFFESQGVRYTPDITVLFFYFNDVWYNDQSDYYRGGKPHFVITEDGLSLTNVPVPPPPQESAADAQPTETTENPEVQLEPAPAFRLRDRIALYRLVRTVAWNDDRLRRAAARLGADRSGRAQDSATLGGVEEESTKSGGGCLGGHRSSPRPTQTSDRIGRKPPRRLLCAGKDKCIPRRVEGHA